LPDHDHRLLSLAGATRAFVGEDALAREFIDFALRRAARSHAQLFQDVLVEYVLGERHGTYVEVGAFDGETYSNTLYLERDLGWTGVLAEPASVHHEKIRRVRPRSRLETRCVFDKSGERVTFSEMQLGELSTVEGFAHGDHMARHRHKRASYEVATVSLDDLIAEHLGDAGVDYISIDTEGTEYKILSASSLKSRPALLTIEHNHSASREKIRDLMVGRHGYVNLMSSISCFDDWYVRGDVYRSRFGATA
jgi:FkbM family methyltransferase